MSALGYKGRQLAIWCQVFARLPPGYLRSIHCFISFLINYPCLWSAVKEDTSLRNTWVAIWYLLLSVELRLTVTGGNNGWRSNNGFWRNNTRRKPRLLWIQNKTKHVSTCERYNIGAIPRYCNRLYSQQCKEHNSWNLLRYSNLDFATEFKVLWFNHIYI